MKIKGFQDTIEWYNKNANKYSQSIKNLPSSGLEAFVNKLPIGSTVLDAGCASGRDSRRLADKNLKVIGLDISPELIEIAKAGNPDIDFVEGNFLALPFENGIFNGIWAHASLLHLEEISEVKKTLTEFNRVLKKGGVLHVYVKAQLTDKKTDIVTDKLSGHDRFFQYFTKQELEKYLTETGFLALSIEEQSDPAGRLDVTWLLCLAQKQS